MTPLITPPEIEYPDSDGMPVAENTLPFQWIVTIQGNLDLLVSDDPNVFVAGDNLIYPVEGDNVTRLAPDVYVAFGRPKGHRGSYKVWREGGVFPQVVFEVLSPQNTRAEMEATRQFYEKYGAEEYYILDPDHLRMQGFVRKNDRLVSVPAMTGWTSPRLGITFDIGDDLLITGPDGQPFRSFVETSQLLRERADEERKRARAEKRRANAKKKRADSERQRAEKLAAKLRELGVDPDA
jgi:Uma2 family endonuclease